MLCENIFCIYNSDDRCQLDEIELDIIGNCKTCVYVEIGKKELEKKKKEQLEKFMP